ncbi:MAG: DUF711 family protein, partial [Chloroflexota bacterium]|nr:DUF711 family protein [Chloroflexota bacterium]
MNIRSLTTAASMPRDPTARDQLVRLLGGFAEAGRASLEAAGLTVQTTRLSTQPLEQWLEPNSEAPAAVRALAEECARSGIGFFSLGTIQAVTGAGNATVAALQEILPGLLMADDNVFASVQVGSHADSGYVVDLDAVRASARIIRTLADETVAGFGNLRFAAASNCPPHVPFFPASYYAEDDRNGGGPEFGLALEAADLAIKAFQNAHSLEEARENLLAMLIDEGGRAAEVCVSIASEHGYTFTGLDISMAPHPGAERSIGRALEMLSGAPLGSPGTFAAAAFFTSVLKEAGTQLPTVGYSGL